MLKSDKLAAVNLSEPSSKDTALLMGNVLSITTSDSISIELNMSLSKLIVKSTESNLNPSNNVEFWPKKWISI